MNTIEFAYQPFAVVASAHRSSNGWIWVFVIVIIIIGAVMLAKRAAPPHEPGDQLRTN